MHPCCRRRPRSDPGLRSHLDSIFVAASLIFDRDLHFIEPLPIPSLRIPFLHCTRMLYLPLTESPTK
jgi:hypothetical protein